MAGAAFAQFPTITSVFNAGAPGGDPSIANRLCPGALAQIFGSNLPTTTAINVTIAGKQAGVLQAQLNQMIIEIPIDAPVGDTSITVSSSSPYPITISPLAPALYTVDGKFAQATNTANGAAVSASSPARSGDVIAFFAAGLGQTAPVVPTGTPSPASPPAQVVSTVAVTIGGVAAQVKAAVLAAGQVGVYELDVAIPAGLTDGAQPVLLTVAGSAPGSLVAANSAQLNFTTQPKPVPLVLENNYSFVPPGMPNYGIAQGSIFVIFSVNGSPNLAPQSSGIQNAPLSGTVNRVSVNVTVNGTTTHPPIYYLASTQMGVVLPSNTPVGDGQISVVSNGQTIGPAPIHVVPSAFGLLTLNGVGTGMAAMYDVNYNLVGFNNSVRPGEVVNLFGSGVGPSPDSDQNLITSPTNLLGTIPVEVTVGGQVAQVTYAGRTIYPGLDQLQIVVPPGVAPGCFVGIVVRTGTMVSNYASIPVTASGRACSEPTIGLTATGIQAVAALGSFAVGSISLGKQVSSLPGTATPSTFSDQVSATFARPTADTFSRLALNQPSAGNCTVYTYTGAPTGPSSGPYQPTALNAGSMLNISGPNGKQTVPLQSGQYAAILGGNAGSSSLPAFIPATGGSSFTFDDGTGGPDVGAFTAAASFSGAGLSWTNQNTIMTVNRSSPPTITWAGGNPNVYVQVSGYSTANGGSGAAFTCTAASTDGQFNLPNGVMLSLPATALPATTNGQLAVAFIALPQVFTAPGIDFGEVKMFLQMISTVVYQ